MFFKKRLEEYYKKQLLIRSQLVSVLVNEMEDYIDKKQVEIVDYKIYLKRELKKQLSDLQKEYAKEQQFFVELEEKLLIYSQLYFERNLAYKGRESIKKNKKIFHAKMELVNNYQKVYEECIAEGDVLIDILSKESDIKSYMKLIAIQNPDYNLSREDSISKQYEKVCGYLNRENLYLSEVRFLLQDIWKGNSSWQKELSTLKACRYQNDRQKRACKEARIKLLEWNQSLKEELEEIMKCIEEMKEKEKESRNEIIELWKKHIKESNEYISYQMHIDDFYIQLAEINSHKTNLYQKMEVINKKTKDYIASIEQEKAERERLYLKMKEYEQEKSFYIADNKRLKIRKNDYIDRVNTFKIQLEEYYSLKNRKWEIINYYKSRREAVPDFDSIMCDIRQYEKSIAERKGYIGSYGKDIGELKEEIGRNQEKIDTLDIKKQYLYDEQSRRKERIVEMKELIEQNNKKCGDLMEKINQDKERIGLLYDNINEQNESRNEFFKKQMGIVKELFLQCERLLV